MSQVVIHAIRCNFGVLTHVLNHDVIGLRAWQVAFSTNFPTNLSPYLVKEVSLALVECPDQPHQVSSYLMAEWLEKNEVCSKLCLAGEYNGKATLGPNSRKLAQSFGLNFCQNIAENMYNTKWRVLKSKMSILIEFDRSQVGYSAGRSGHLGSLQTILLQAQFERIGLVIWPQILLEDTSRSVEQVCVWRNWQKCLTQNLA